MTPSDGTFLNTSRCTATPYRESDLDLNGTHGSLRLEDLGILYCVALTHQTDENLKPLYFFHIPLSETV